MVTRAAEIGAAWVILCVCCAAGLFLGERLLIMARLGCDWADAGARQRILARKHYARHRRMEVRSSRPVLAPVPPGAIERADRVLENTVVVTPVSDEAVITGVPAEQDSPTQTFVRDTRTCCGTAPGTRHLPTCTLDQLNRATW